MDDMDLKTVLDLYEQGEADLLDVALIFTEECGTSDPTQTERVREIIKRDCK